MKVALVCTGLGNVWRGYERFTRDWFDLIHQDLEMTLFKGGAETSGREVAVPNLKRDGILSRFLKPNASKNPYYYEALSFYAFLLPQLLAGDFDLVHFIDCPLANFLYHTKKMGLKPRFKTLFTNAISLTDPCLKRVDYLHQLTPLQAESAKDYGIPESQIFMVPFGIHSNRFHSLKSREELRNRYGVPQHARVVLAVSALNRTHKRIDAAIEEVASLGPDYFFFVAGHREDESLTAFASQRLGTNFKFTHVPFSEANEIYAMADVFVMPSLIEGFGLALIEAMAAKIPVIAHDSPHNQWLAGDSRCLTDLTRPGNMAQKIADIFKNPLLWQEITVRNYENVIRRFDWQSLKGDYLEMYQKAVCGEPAHEPASV